MRLSIAVAAVAVAACAGAGDFPIGDYGARADGGLCTEAVAAAMSAANAAGGGRVVVPAGRWTTGPVRFRSNCELHLEKGAKLFFTDDLRAYLPGVRVSWEGVECFNVSPLVYAFGCTNVAITGAGTLKAKTDFWWSWAGPRKPDCEVANRLLKDVWSPQNVPVAERQLWKEPNARFRPHFLHFNRCQGVRLEGFAIRGSPFWTVHLFLCDGVVARDLDIDATCDDGRIINNTDGIDIEATRNVLVERCTFCQGDDAIVLKSGKDFDGRRLATPTENVVVRDCTVRRAHNLVAVGSELSGGVRNVRISNCRIVGPVGELLHVKTNPRRGGFVEDIALSDIVAGDLRERVFGLTSRYYFGAPGEEAFERDYFTPIRGIVLRNVRCRSARRRFDLQGDYLQPAENVTFENVIVDRTSEPDYVANVRNLRVDGHDIAPTAVPATARELGDVDFGKAVWHEETREYVMAFTDGTVRGTSVRRSRDRKLWSDPVPAFWPGDWDAAEYATGSVRKPAIRRTEKGWYLDAAFADGPRSYFTPQIFWPFRPEKCFGNGFESLCFPSAVDGEVRFAPTNVVRSCFYAYSRPVRITNAKTYGLAYSIKADACGLFLGGCDEARVAWTAPDCGWRSYRQVYVPTGVPGESREMPFSVGHYRARGDIRFRGFSLCELKPEYAVVEGLTLGHGESVVGNRYTFAAVRSSRNGGHSRAFVSHEKTSIDLPACRVRRGGSVVFRHELAGRRFLRATVRTCVPDGDVTNNFTLAVSTDGAKWTTVAAIEGAIRPRDIELPRSVFPAERLWIRFGDVRGRGASLDDYQLVADVDGRPVRAFGWTKYRNAATGEVFAEEKVSERGAGIPEGCAWRLVGGDVDFWGAASEVKVFRDSPLPKAKEKELTLRLAGNERESVQFVVTPREGDLADVRLMVDDLVCGEARIPFSHIRVERVGYVDVTTPSDTAGQVGLFPDPLLPQDGTKYPVRRGENQPFWITVRTEKGQPAGLYRGQVRVTCDGRTANVPIAVEVFGFDLPDTMSCQSSFGIGRGRFCEYCRVDKNSPLADELTEKHVKFFAEHRLTAQAWDKSVRPRVTWRNAADPARAEPVFDWTAFDDWVIEMRGRFGFTTFQFPVEGLGEGFAGRFTPGGICGVKADDPRYETLMAKYLGAVERHLAELGILETSYAYWYDEPATECLGQVDWGMGVLRRHAPGIRRMVTSVADKERMGNVNLWCCPVNELLRGDVEGCRARGDGFWWYVCNYPKAPYPTMFTDHAGCPLKTWLWMTWGEGASGVLCWETSYWTRQNAAYPDPKRMQDPYADAMSWSATAGRWSNGCGRLAYPPRAAVENPSGKPVLDGPNGCCRADALRDGIEDYEYFALLRKADPRNPLLAVPKEVYTSIVDFNTDPTPMREHRIRLAREIVRLGGGAPRVEPACCVAVRPSEGRDFGRIETPAGTVLVAPFDDRIGETLWRFERMEKPLPKAAAVVLQLGTHDRGAKPEDMAKGMEKVIAAVARRLPQAKIAVYAIFPSAQTWRNFRNREANELYGSLADGKTVFYRDINGNLDPRMFSDGLHPGDAVRKIWTDDIREFVCGGSAVRKLALPALFGDHALLQRAGDTAVWGEASTGREVEVSLGGATARAKADSDGWWLARLDTSKIGDGPFELVVRCGDETLVSKDVVLGELWLSGGQSNMDFRMRSASYGWIFGADAYRREAAGRPLRFFRTRDRGGLTPRKGAVSGAWYVASADSITNASAVSYCFIDAVQREVGGNFGFVDISCGGSRVWQWLSPSVVRSVPELKREYDEQAAARRQGTPEGDWRARKSICQLYNGTFHPLKDLSCRGVIWYQGENDGELGNDGAETYADWFTRQIESWREDMGRPGLPFYYCQIAGWNGPLREPGGRSGKAAVREGQRRVARRLENVGMAVILQQSEVECHGRDKKPAGERLARIALARTYGKTDLVWRAPDFREMTVADGKARLRFDTFASTLSAAPIRTSYTVSREGERKGTPTKAIERRSSAASQLEGFDLRDAEGRWHWADARIVGPDTVEVWAEGAGRPVEVRYNWGDVAFGNLYDTTGLPVSPFVATDSRGQTPPSAWSARSRRR